MQFSTLLTLLSIASSVSAFADCAGPSGCCCTTWEKRALGNEPTVWVKYGTPQSDIEEYLATKNANKKL